MRKNKQGGFTLIEMLIVVAIIAILVAVSIPIVNNSLERARESTDMANERAFKAEVLIVYLNGDDTVDGYEEIVGGTTAVYYDAANGKIVSDISDIETAYGKNTEIDGGTGYDDTTLGGSAHTDQVLSGTFTVATGELEMEWVDLS